MPQTALRTPSPQPRQQFAKALAVLAWAGARKCTIDEIITEKMPGQHRIHGLAQLLQTRTATGILDRVDADALIESTLAEITAALLPLSGYARLRALANQFESSFGRPLIPAIPAADPNRAAWVGETAVIPVTGPPIAGVLAPSSKVACIAPYSRELDSASAGIVGRTLQTILLQDAGARLDSSLTDDSPAIPELRPAGLLAGVVPIASTDFATDMGELIDAAAGWALPVLLIDPSQLKSAYADAGFGPGLAAGKLGPFTVITSPNWADPTAIIAVDAGAFYGGLGLPDVSVSPHAILTMANADGTAPTQAVTAAGAINVPGEVAPGLGIHVNGPIGAGTAGYQAMSMLQMNSVALRAVLPATWGLSRDSVAALSGADW